MTSGLGHIFGRLALASAAAACLASAPARAADLSAPVATDKHEWDVAFGVTFTSDYLSRGTSSTEHNAAIQPWAELDIGHFYAGYWGSNVSTGGATSWESDLSIGVRPTLGPVSFDFGYVRYLFTSSAFSADYGEVYGKASITPVDPLTVGVAFYVNPEVSSATYAELNAAYTFLEKFKASGAVGYVANNATFGNYAPWNLGLSWTPVDPVTFDVRYHGGPDADRFMASVSLATSLKKLGVIH